MTEMTLTETLGAFCADAGPVPPHVLERVRVSLVHNLAVALAGRERESVAHRVAVAHPGPATLLATGGRSAPDWAALANGALFHARSQDDTHPASTSHPGAPVMAAALAVAEAEGRSGAEFLDAVALGYEVLCRVGRDFDQEVTRRGFRAAAVWGGFGAAAAAARLRRLDGRATAHALALAVHQAGGVAQVWREGSPEFPLQLGYAARNGVVAAELAAAGAAAGRRMLEGEAGLYAAYAGVQAPPTEALEDLGRRWQFEDTTVKAFPACAILQGPMELILALRERAGDRVESCVLSLNPYEADYPGIDNSGPTFASTTATKMSAQFCLAVGLLEGRLALADLARLDDPRIGALAGRIEVRRDPEVPERQCRIELRLAGGETAGGSIDEAVGRPDFAGIRAFATRLAPEMGMSAPAVTAWVDEVTRLDRQGDLGPLVSALTRTDEARPAGAG